MVRTLSALSAAILLAATFACSGGEEPLSPASPTGGVPAETDAASDGTNLKATPPEQTSPADGAELEDFEVVLRVNPSSLKFGGTLALTYRFQLLEGSSVVKQSNDTSSRSWTVGDLENDTTYGWRARAEFGDAIGPWSPIRTFRTPDQPEAYSIPGELYDPLIDGKSIGEVIGPTTFIKDKGIRIDHQLGRVKYVLKQTVPSGEFSMLVTGLLTNTEGQKTKIMSMAEGSGADITTNNRRMTLEKRGDPPGIVAWRFISHRSQIETGRGERFKLEFNPNRVYLWIASWRNSRFRVQIFEGGANGKEIYDLSKPFRGEYDPVPHTAFVGGPPGRAGVNSGSVDRMVVRQVWLSERPRPSFANK
jgi:hypothetical protein